MKKRITKKLELNKETLINLDESIMKDVKGGDWAYPPTVTSFCVAGAC